MNKNQAILINLKNQIDLTSLTDLHKQKAYTLCVSIFNQYINDGGDFNQFRQFSNKFFKVSIPSNEYRSLILKTLIESKILEVNNSYNIKKHLSKSYKLNSNIIYYYNNLDYTIFVSSSCGTKETERCFLMFPNKENINISSMIISQLERLTFRPEVSDHINNFKINDKDIILDNEITDSFFDIRLNGNKYRYSLDKAIQQAKEMNINLIKYEDRYYLEDIKSFIIRKEIEIKLIYKKSVFDIENKIFRASRNETNNRLDYNLTNIWSELLEYILFDNEELLELDISNAQFAILSHLNEDIDSDFIKYSQEGTLYNYLSDILPLTEKESKFLMFRNLFGKVEESILDDIFPLTIEYINNYKIENGYKSISNLLQKTESRIMIDGLLNNLIENGYEVFPIHDAMRIKKSQYDIIIDEINNYFKEIGFKCKIRNKK